MIFNRSYIWAGDTIEIAIAFESPDFKTLIMPTFVCILKDKSIKDYGASQLWIFTKCGYE